MVHMTCQCGKELTLADKYAGRRIRCPQCQTTLIAGATDEDAPFATEVDDSPPMSEAPPYVPNRAPHRSRRRQPVKKRSGPAVALVVILILLGGAGTIIGVMLSQKDDRPGSTQAGDRELLNGKWVCTHSRHTAEAGATTAGNAKGLIFTIRGDNISIINPDGTSSRGTLELKPSASPKVFDIQSPFGDQIGIYKLEGDTLTVCWALIYVEATSNGEQVTKEAPRPKAINPSQGMVLVMKRQE